MLLLSETVYNGAAEYLRGNNRRDRHITRFMSRFADSFGVAPIAIETDTRSHGRDPRLRIVLARTQDAKRFRSTDGNFDRAKQAECARIWWSTMPRRGMRKRFGLTRDTRRVDWVHDLFVCFSSFERDARLETHREFLAHGRAELAARLGIADCLWKAEAVFEPPVIFLETDAQVALFNTPAIQREWGDIYFSLVTKYDEFGYLERDDLTLIVDSKERYFREFQGNGHHYYLSL